MENLEFIKDIKSYNINEKITEGYSGDIKYKIEKDGKHFLLRISDSSKRVEKQKEYERLAIYADKEINTHKPVTLGSTADKFYTIVSWVDGTPIMDIIKADVSKNYYQLGKKVGTELKKLHLASECNSSINWYNVFKNKATSILIKYHSMQIEFSFSKSAEVYILNNFPMISNRPVVCMHGDFHWNNCVVDENGKVGIIDFSGNDIGDPWYEFGGMVWALEYSESFVNGQIDGYFGAPPDEFWKVLKLYVALYAFEHLTYHNGNAEDLKNRICNASRILRIWGEDFELDIPVFRR